MSSLFLTDDGVDLALRGFARVHPQVSLHADPTYATTNDRHPNRRVGLVSGGGSGHEPLHVGMVGRGLLDAAVPGRIFASPHNRQVLEASRRVAGPEGVLHIVKNYTGDRINFGIAAERLRDEGIAVQRVLVDDDIATENAQTATGRRGTAGTVIVEKVLGAAADEGHGLDDLVEVGADVARRSRSVAVARRAQTTLSGGPAFTLADDELEYGVGIHGERAAETIPRPPLDVLVGRMLDDLLQRHEEQRGVVLLVNGLGATTQLELLTIAELAAEHLGSRRVRLLDVLVGTFVPALDMSGFSLTTSAMTSDQLHYWRAEADAPGWPRRPR
ncbi:dihydroxyacetone kinase subunit DhaK [Aeromicrobium camelliae]|uniref:Dihydroxyacetone kinase subunit DhaK n=1 Tax=Aeromicrobium camelliae TaxID=1538144 RepID=A0A3N6WMV9_9ACTN|nr:dihydroxyacetone kinase subunit DhaK [Aeromicrobium camelliae]RQN08896.1 dihydroxyacetone kinase subunit DhaK [Aeromicrobium camelliae]